MLSKDAQALWRSINECRQHMYELAQEKNITDPQVIKISQKLDREIVTWQRLRYKISCLSK